MLKVHILEDYDINLIYLQDIFLVDFVILFSSEHGDSSIACWLLFSISIATFKAPASFASWDEQCSSC
jgi:hypothetical protein